MKQVFFSSTLMWSAPLQDMAQVVRDHQLAGIEVWAQHFFYHQYDRNVYREYAAKFQMKTFVHRCSWDLNLASLNEGIRQASVQEVIASLHLARDLEASEVTVHPGHMTMPFWPRTSVALFHQSLEQIAEASHALAIPVSLELMEKIPKEFVTSVEAMENAAGDLFDAFYYTLDTAHCDSTAEIRRILNEMPRLSKIHISNRQGPVYHTPLREGDYDFMKLLPVLYSRQLPLVVEGFDAGTGYTILHKNLDFLHEEEQHEYMDKKNLRSLTGVTLFSLAGCGGSGEQSSAAKDDLKGEVVLYTSQPEKDAQKLIEAFNKEHPDVKVSVFRSGTEEVISKVMAEQSAGDIKADVLLVADNVTFESLKNKDMLEAYESSELSGIPSQFIDKDHMYTGTKVITTGIMVNTDKAKEQPAAFADLTKPAMKDEVSMPSPLYSGAAAYNLSLLTRTNGLGWDWYNALKANGVKVDKGNGSVQKAVVSGEKAYGIVADFMANRSRKDGAPVTFIYPSEGSPAVTEPIGLVKNAKHKKAAQAFIDFVLSKKGQELAASIGYTPIKEGVAAPEGLKSITDIHVLSGDVTTLFTNREADKKQFSSIFS